jgi:acyl carrier protein
MNMSNLEKYNEVFMECLDIEEEKLGDSLEYQSVDTWDSVGHMDLIAELEDAFDISFETDDIVDFSSYNKGIEILKKYQVQIN